MHFDVGEEFLASVLQAGTKEVNRIVDDEKTVMIALAYIDRNRWNFQILT